MNNSTTIPSGKNIQRKWFVLDATGKTLGRLATQAANILSGKNNVQYIAWQTIISPPPVLRSLHRPI